MINPPMKTSANGRALIEAYEGLILSAYDDATDRVVPAGGHVRGTLTIGYGHTSAAGLPRVYVGMAVTREEADAILSSDLAAVEADVNHHVTVPISQDVFDALVSFDFNVGALDRSSTLHLINTGNLAAGAQALMLWDHAGGRVNAGLEKRRAAERDLMLTGKWRGP